MTIDQRQTGSFRDPSGFLFWRQNRLFRQINQSYRKHYELLVASGLYDNLTQDGLLISHDEVEETPADATLAYKIICPTPVPFISYPYEWSFSQLKDAALTTLALQKHALDAGMWLKDASVYNIQFFNGRPTLIDTLSFEKYPEGSPWVAYRQFCQHFLAPLALITYTDVRLSQLMRIYIDGIPLDLASRLLPWRTRLSFGLLNHIHLHAAAQKRYAEKAFNQAPTRPTMSRNAMYGWIDNLKSTVQKLNWKPAGTAWANYYQSTNYSDNSSRHKAKLVKQYLDQINPQKAWDLGANTGQYSRIASSQGIQTIAFDIDSGAVEINYQQTRQNNEKHLLPLILDLTNPSPGLGWRHQERDALLTRPKPDVTMALALIHHLAIVNNVPLSYLAKFFAEISPWLIIEFVPKTDSQVKRLLATRKDIFDTYTRPDFEQIFGQWFQIHEKTAIEESDRSLYLMQRKSLLA